jgi:arylsulfatase A-like enzyme
MRISRILILSSLFLFSTCGRRSDQPDPAGISDKQTNLLLITIDTLRADHLSCYGYPRQVSPVLDRLSQGGMLAVNAICVSPITNPSHASLFTGLYPWEHGCRSNYMILPQNAITLAEILKERKYSTAAFVSGSPVRAEVSALNQGFDHYNDEMTGTTFKAGKLLQNTGAPASKPDSPQRVVASYERRDGRETLGKATDWLEKMNSPWFVWVHLYDVHGPYTPRHPMRSVFDGDGWDTEKSDLTGVWIPEYQASPGSDRAEYIRRYDSNVYYDDEIAGSLLRRIHDRREAESTCVVVMSDHGESLGENDYGFDHGRYVYQNALQIPLMIKLPGSISPGVIHENLIGEIDILPTILTLLGQGSNPSTVKYVGRGQKNSCKKLPFSGDTWRFCETNSKHPEEPSGRRYAVSNGRHKYIFHKSAEDSELYDLAEDPPETRSLNGQIESINVQNTLRNMIENGILSRISEAPEADEISDSQKEALQKLGYME